MSVSLGVFRCRGEYAGQEGDDQRAGASRGFLRVTSTIGSSRELESLEAMQRLLDQPPARSARILGEPGPFLHLELLPLAIRLEIEDSDNVVADQHRLREIAEQPLLL